MTLLQKIFTATNIGIMLPGIIAVLALLFRTDKEEGNKLLKKPNLPGVISIILILVVVIVSVLYQMKIEEFESNEMDRQLERYARDSATWALSLTEVETLRKEEKSRFDTSIENFAIQLENQATTLRGLQHVLSLQSESLKQATGGNSFGYVNFNVIWDHKPGTRDIQYTVRSNFLNMGEYPLYNTDILIWEPIRDFERKPNSETWYNIPVLDKSLDKAIYGNVVDNGRNNLFIKKSFPLGERLLDPDEKKLVFKVKIYSRNDSFEQTTKFEMIKLPNGEYGLWVKASRIWSFGLKEFIYEDIYPDFPRDSLGEIDWTYDKIIHENLKLH